MDGESPFPRPGIPHQLVQDGAAFELFEGKVRTAHGEILATPGPAIAADVSDLSTNLVLEG